MIYNGSSQGFQQGSIPGYLLLNFIKLLIFSFANVHLFTQLSNICRRPAEIATFTHIRSRFQTSNVGGGLDGINYLNVGFLSMVYCIPVLFIVVYFFVFFF